MVLLVMNLVTNTKHKREMKLKGEYKFTWTNFPFDSKYTKIFFLIQKRAQIPEFIVLNLFVQFQSSIFRNQSATVTNLNYFIFTGS